MHADLRSLQQSDMEAVARRCGKVDRKWINLSGFVTNKRTVLLDGLTKRDPEPIEIADDKLPHAIERVVEFLHHLHTILQPLIEIVDVARLDI